MIIAIAIKISYRDISEYCTYRPGLVNCALRVTIKLWNKVHKVHKHYMRALVEVKCALSRLEEESDVDREEEGSQQAMRGSKIKAKSGIHLLSNVFGVMRWLLVDQVVINFLFFSSKVVGTTMTFGIDPLVEDSFHNSF